LLYYSDDRLKERIIMPIEWNDDLKTGIPIIDEQHQELIVMLNRLGRLKCGKDCFLDALTELQEYVNTHFKTEEDYMVLINYHEYNEHKSCHDKFSEEINTIHKNIDKVQNIDALGIELHDLAADWIINHYSDEDVKLADYIKQHS
jgi:hemerythrin